MSRLREMGVFFAHPSNVIVYAGATLFTWLAGPNMFTLAGIVAFVTAFAVFPVIEYVSHRYVLHAAKSKHRVVARMQERWHHAHHRDPDDLSQVFGPLWATVPTAVGWWLIARAITGEAVLAHCFTSGLFFVYLYYEWAHFVAHRPITPWTPWGKWMKAFHLWHHYKNEHLWYGVTNPIVDIAVGTNQDIHNVPKSPTTHDLS